MKALQLTFFVLMLIASTQAQKQVLNPKKDICRLFKNGVKLRKPGFCDRQVICQDFKSVEGVVCIASLPFYSRDKGKCVASDADAYCKSPCTGRSPTYTKDKKNCQGWYNCDGMQELAHGICASNHFFDESSQLCDYPERVACEATYTFCDVAPAKVKFLDEGNCHKYFVCEKSALKKKTTLKSYSCPLGLYFDAASGVCIPKAQVNCYKHPYPKEVCGSSKVSYRNRFVNDEATCRGYFYCQDFGTGKPDASPSWGQCQLGMFFEQSQQSCLGETHVKCAEDRCDGHGNGLALSETPGCQHYLVCENNYTVREEKCENNKYFDAERSQCSSAKMTYPACS